MKADSGKKETLADPVEVQGQMEPTPRPWRIESDRISYLGLEEFLCSRPESVVINMPAPPFALGSCGTIFLGDNAKSNAELTLRAVNNFDALVEACKGLLVCIGSFSRTGTYPSPDEPEIVKARAAISASAPPTKGTNQ